MLDEKNKRNALEIPHNIIVESREKLSITGVEEVESFDENEVIIHTTKGMLTVTGEGLHVEKLNLENSEIKILGEIYTLIYTDDIREKGNFFQRLFR